MKRTLTLAVAALLVYTALPAAAGPADHAGVRAGRVEVMTQNLYVGADIFRIFDAQSPAEIPLVVAGILQTVFATDFPGRAEALAEEIRVRRPHLIGLQEVSLIRYQSPGDFFLGNPTPAGVELFDYLEILLDALEARGLHYEVAAVVENADVELPVFVGLAGDGTPLLDDVRLTDRDVILARSDVATDDALGRNFAVNLQIPLAGFTVPFLRGFTAVDATVHGRTYRFVNTHLEVGSPVPAVQSAQALELIAELAGEAAPVILVGDLNSAPDDPPTQPYWLFTGAGYVDTWTRRLGRPEEGFTCCQEETLDNPVSLLDERIDHIFAANGAELFPFATVGPVRSQVVGDEPRDRTESGLWWSDHAGVVARLLLAVPKP